MLCPIVGGNWNNTTNAGVWYRNFNNNRANSDNNVGFRCDYRFPLRARLRTVENIGMCCPALSELVNPLHFGRIRPEDLECKI
jgi:hypothetical protein